MKILGIDTSTMMGAVGIVDGEELVAELRTNVAVTHSERLMAHVDSLLKSARLTISDMDGFAVNVGPGSFTGLRIGLAAVKGMAYSTGKPIAAVGALDALADNLPFCAYQVCPVLDARKKMVYAAIYRDAGGARDTLLPVSVLTPDELVGHVTGPAVFIGEGAHVYHDYLMERLGAMAHFAPRAYSYPSGATLAFRGLAELEAGRAADPFSLVPSYIRDADAVEKKKGG